MKTHEAADIFPMMPEDELGALADDIKANGLIHPLITDSTGEILLDGRNRFKACKMAGVEPRFEKLNGKDPLAYIVSANLARRNLTKGQQAMGLAMIYPDTKPGKKRTSSETEKVSTTRLSVARTVLRLAKQFDMISIPQAVMKGDLGVDEALQKMLLVDRQKEHAEEQAEQSKQERARVRKVYPDLMEKVESGKMALDDAVVQIQERDERRRLLIESGKDAARRIDNEFSSTVVSIIQGIRCGEKIQLKPGTLDSIMRSYKMLVKELEGK